MTEAQRKAAVGVLQEEASTARRAYGRYVRDSVNNNEASPAAPAYIIHAEACEATIKVLMALTPSDA